MCFAVLSTYVNAAGKIDYPIIFGQLTKRDGSFLVGKQAEPNFSWASLKGKRVLAGRVGGMPAMTLQYVCNTNGVSHGADGFNFDTSVAFDMMAPVFESDATVNYTTMFEPLASSFVAAGKGHIVASVGSVSGEVPYTAFSASKSYIENNRELIKKFLIALINGYKFMTTAPVSDVADALMPSFPSTSKETIIAVLNSYIGIDAWSSTPVMTQASFNKLQDIMENAGQLAQRADFSKIVDNTYATQAVDSTK